MTFKFVHFINLKAVFPVVSTDFPEMVHVKEKKREGSIASLRALNDYVK